jgi:hypothetical protein
MITSDLGAMFARLSSMCLHWLAFDLVCYDSGQGLSTFNLPSSDNLFIPLPPPTHTSLSFVPTHTQHLLSNTYTPRSNTSPLVSMRVIHLLLAVAQLAL